MLRVSCYLWLCLNLFSKTWVGLFVYVPLFFFACVFRFFFFFCCIFFLYDHGLRGGCVFKSDYDKIVKDTETPELNEKKSMSEKSNNNNNNNSHESGMFEEEESEEDLKKKNQRYFAQIEQLNKEIIIKDQKIEEMTKDIVNLQSQVLFFFFFFFCCFFVGFLCVLYCKTCVMCARVCLLVLFACYVLKFVCVYSQFLCVFCFGLLIDSKNPRRKRCSTIRNG